MPSFENVAKIVLDKIASDLIATNTLEIDERNVYTGKTGIALFLAYYYKYSQDEKYLEKVYQIMSSALNEIDQEKSISLSGTSGIGWVLQHLTQLGVFSQKETQEYLATLNHFVMNSLIYDKQQDNYDLMHGYIGKLIYLISSHKLSKQPQVVTEYILEFIDYFHEKSKKENDHAIFWTQSNSVINGKINKVCLGLAHGMPSIISFLCLLLETFDLPQERKFKASELIQKACTWILNQRGIYEVKRGVYPTFIPPDNTQKEGYLAWCYGDLGIAIALTRAGKTIQNKLFYQEGIKIAVLAAKRDLITSGISQDATNFDSTICHGLFGILYQFHILYKMTQEPIFKSTVEYWLNIALDKTDLELSFCGFQACISPRQNTLKEWRDDPTLLGGAAGIGLVLLDYYFPLIKPPENWAKILLLDI
ncbi:lanthionine synthetase C family protein [Microscilla marina]|uniref:Lanthionine synthetase C-like protein n=1 Tax=Microscilla marina ATCC 23134 TaxID=313606 RepID=A1ZIL5_MICM2|nr:lanthionine synthetase C family protein [Microscilla marina]EAY29883.1 conserved hypothetical protein [Microscilla marina ATCC 23134]